MFPYNYDRFPAVYVSHLGDCTRGWQAVTACLRAAAAEGLTGCSRWIIAVECYPGVHDDELVSALRSGLHADHWIAASEAFLPDAAIDRMLAPYLGGDDPIFGFLTPLTLDSFLDPDKVSALRRRIENMTGLVVVYGTGALLCAEADMIVYADMPRWEGQLRQRRGEVDNLGVRNRGLKASRQYKRSFFVDWRVCDRLKKATLSACDFLLDTTIPDDPRMITGATLRKSLAQTTQQPFRVVPFFDPAPWGGQWMRQVCGLDPEPANFGWCFDCVPEENSLRLRFRRC